MLVFSIHTSLVVAAAEAMKTRLSTAVVSRSTLLNITIDITQCLYFEGKLHILLDIGTKIH